MRINIPLHDVQITVLEKAVRDISEQLLYYSNLDYDLQKQLIIKSPTQIHQMEDKDELNLKTDAHVVVSFNTSYDTTTPDARIYQQQQYPMFKMPHEGIFLTPKYQNAILTMTITFNHGSYDQLFAFLQRLRQESLDGQLNFYHDIIYDYALPHSVVDYLHTVYTNVEAVGGYGDESFLDFMNRFSTQDLTLRSNLSGEHKELVVIEKQIGCLGLIDGLPESIEVDVDNSMNRLELSYKVNYSQPALLLMNIQKYVHNAMINIRDFKDFYRYAVDHGTPTGPGYDVLGKLFREPMDTHVKNLMISWNKYYDIDDRWSPVPRPIKYFDMLIIPMQLDTEDLTLIEDIRNIQHPRVPKLMLEMYDDSYKDMFILGKHPFYITVFEVNEKIRRIQLTTDTEDIHILRSQFELDVRSRHYLYIGLTQDPSEACLKNYLYRVDLLYKLLKIYKPSLEIIDISEYNDKLKGEVITTIGEGTKAVRQSVVDVLNTIRTDPYGASCMFYGQPLVVDRSKITAHKDIR